MKQIIQNYRTGELELAKVQCLYAQNSILEFRKGGTDNVSFC
jgi:hypothetical protein